MGDMEKLMNRNNTGVVLRDIHGETFYSTGTAEHREILPLSQISPYVQKAVVASEDRNFYEHGGVSILSTMRAVYGYVFSGGGEFGGSTLTQQLAKMTLLSTERGFLRQYQALSVAIAIEQRYSKDEILAMYLNAAYFGNNSFGIEQAAKNYFDKKPIDLTLAESAMLIGLLPAPSVYSPITGDAAKGVERQAEVLRRMVRDAAITEAERTQAMQVELSYQPPAEIKNDAPHFTEMVLAELYDKYGEETVERAGYQVTTTLDLSLQRKAVKNVKERVSYIQNMGGSNAGLIAIDPKTGEIRALVGSVDYSNPEWGTVNMATTKRQPGTTFKSIDYAAALADGVITPATVIRDEAININGYQPHNATRRYYGNVTVREALARSLNIPAVKVMQQYGIENSINAAKKLGVTTLDNGPNEYGLALAIGAAEVPLQQMTNAYAAFADGGSLHENTTIHEIKDKFDKSIYQHKQSVTQGVSQQGAYLISSILSDQNARSFMFGNSLNVRGKTVAVKTGTTDDNRDAWAIGYTPDVAIGVWVGNNNNDTMVSGGADMAGPIWRATMQDAIGNGTPSFSRPDGVIERNVCRGSGGLALTAGTNTYREVFLVGALPQASCNATPQKVEEEKPPEEEPVTTPVVPTPEEEEPVTPDEPAPPEEVAPVTPVAP
jgi:penicillin-binding protein 1A